MHWIKWPLEVLRHCLCCQGFFNAECSTGFSVSSLRVKHCESYCKSTFKLCFLPAMKLSNGTLDTSPNQVSARVIITSLCSLGIIKHLNRDEDHLMSWILMMANFTIHRSVWQLLHQRRDLGHTSQFIP